MIVPREAAVVKQIRRLLSTRGAYHVKTAPPIESGTPDVLACVQGRFVGLEVKRPGGVATPLQRLRIEQIIEAGGVAAVVESASEAERILCSAGL